MKKERTFTINVFFESEVARHARRKSGQWHKTDAQRQRDADALLRGGKIRRI